MKDRLAADLEETLSLLDETMEKDEEPKRLAEVRRPSVS